ncbi:MAG: peptide deformylase [Clostridia bacterium]|nr:peptide deformylase [Clostridia bacterium]
MAIRTILNEKEDILHKVCRPVTEFNERLWEQLDDMAETLEASNGVGLAAPQVGILRRFFIMDVGDGLVEAINPTIIAKKGTQDGQEGCLSSPGKWGMVERPQKVILKAQDRYGKEFTLSSKDLAARCICHETDHLDGILFAERAHEMLQET